jgi:hypothetical protein
MNIITTSYDQILPQSPILSGEQRINILHSLRVTQSDSPSKSYTFCHHNTNRTTECGCVIVQILSQSPILAFYRISTLYKNNIQYKISDSPSKSYTLLQTQTQSKQHCYHYESLDSPQSPILSHTVTMNNRQSEI